VARTLRSDLRAFAARAGDAVPGWVGGAMAGLQSVLVSMGAVVAVALAVAAASPPADGSAGVDWESAAVVGVRVWLLAHAVAAGTATASVSLVPLGLTVIFGSLAAGLARRFAIPTTGSWLAFTATYTAGVVAVASASDSAATAPNAVTRAAVVGVLVAGGGAGAGLRRAGWLRGSGMRRLPAALSGGWRLGAATALGIWAAGALAFCVWAVSGWSDIARVGATLDADPVGTLALGLGEAAYAPTMAVWGAAWLAGPGFAVGAGTEYSPGHLTTGPLPSVPILGALPHASGGLLVLAPLVIVAIAVAARLLAGRWTPRPGIGTQVVGVIVVAALVGAGAVASRGSLGGGSLASVGPSPVETALWVGFLVALGLAGVSLAARWAGSNSASRRGRGGLRSPNPSGERSRSPQAPSGTRTSPPP